MDKESDRIYRYTEMHLQNDEIGLGEAGLGKELAVSGAW